MDPLTIYRDLKYKIIWLELPPGTTLNQAEIAQNYGVSRTPLTIALTRLDSEEWLIKQGSHYVVSPLTIDRMRNITEMRSVLESQANVWAMYRMSATGMDGLKQIEKEIKELRQDASKRELFHLDYKFHSLLYRESHNAQLEQFLKDLLSHYIRFWLASHKKTNKDIFFGEAIEICKAIRAKDEDSLRKYTASHIKVSLDKILEM
jgi:GntR family transcriptional regulator, rspAB operon transcriptional repressor